jgi:hypothetical protein
MTDQRPEDDATRSFEYLDDASATVPADQPAPGRRRGRRALIGLTAAAVLLAGGAGAFAVAQFLSGGPQASTAAPADAMAFLSVDLDPSGGQKVAAYRTLKKFPAIEDQLGLTSQDDLRSWVFEGLTSDADCSEVRFEDVDPWLGNALGVGAVPGDEGPTVFLALEVTDQDKAGPGVRALGECLGEDEIGTAFTGDFMIVAETSEEAEAIAQSAEESSLADDPTYAARTGEAGEDGVVTGYLSPSFGDYVSEQVSTMGGMSGPMGGTFEEEATLAGRAGALTEDTSEPGGDEPGDDFPELEDDFGSGMPPGMMMMGLPGMLLGGLGGFGGPGLGGLDRFADQMADFEGAAVQVRFADESLEVEYASAGYAPEVADEGTLSLGDLPADTGVALGLATGESWADGLLEGLRSSGGDSFDEEMAEASEATGLSLPEDLTTIVGDSVTVVFDSSVDFPVLFESFFFGAAEVDVEAGLRITGDADEIAPLVEKLAAYAADEGGPEIVVEQGDGVVAVGLDPDYVAELAQGGDLGGSSAFQQALPDDGDSLGAAFADFDANGWLDRALDDSSEDDRANAEPLSALGVTSTRDGDSLHGVLRLTTD